MWEKEKEFRALLDKASKRPSKSALKELAILAVDDERQCYKHVSALLERQLRKCNSKDRVHVFFVLSTICRESAARNGIRSKYVLRLTPHLREFGALLSGSPPTQLEQVKKILRIWQQEKVFSLPHINIFEAAMQGDQLVENEGQRRIEEAEESKQRVSSTSDITLPVREPSIEDREASLKGAPQALSTASSKVPNGDQANAEVYDPFAMDSPSNSRESSGDLRRPPPPRSQLLPAVAHNAEPQQEPTRPARRSKWDQAAPSSRWGPPPPLNNSSLAEQPGVAPVSVSGVQPPEMPTEDQTHPGRRKRRSLWDEPGPSIQQPATVPNSAEGLYSSGPRHPYQQNQNNWPPPSHPSSGGSIPLPLSEAHPQEHQFGHSYHTGPPPPYHQYPPPPSHSNDVPDHARYKSHHPYNTAPHPPHPPHPPNNFFPAVLPPRPPPRPPTHPYQNGPKPPAPPPPPDYARPLPPLPDSSQPLPPPPPGPPPLPQEPQPYSPTAHQNLDLTHRPAASLQINGPESDDDAVGQVDVSRLKASSPENHAPSERARTPISDVTPPDGGKNGFLSSPGSLLESAANTDTKKQCVDSAAKPGGTASDEDDVAMDVSDQE